MTWISSVLKTLQFFLEWKAEEARFKTLYSIHDRYEIQKNRVKIISQDLHDAVGRGADTNNLRLLENDLATETEYLRTLEDHLNRWRDVSTE